MTRPRIYLSWLGVDSPHAETMRDEWARLLDAHGCDVMFWEHNVPGRGANLSHAEIEDAIAGADAVVGLLSADNASTHAAAEISYAGGHGGFDSGPLANPPPLFLYRIGDFGVPVSRQPWHLGLRFTVIAGTPEEAVGVVVGTLGGGE